MPAVTVVGSVNLDVVAHCQKLPLPGETVTARRVSRYPGGKGANQALAAARGGAEVSLVAAVGDDSEATEALTLVREAGIGLDSLVVTSLPTGTALIAVDDAGQNQIIVVPGANGALEPGAVDVSDAELVLCQLEVPMETISAVAHTATGLLCVNTAPARSLPDQVLERADMLIMNETERDALAGQIVDVHALVVITLGAAGAKAYRGGRLVAEAQPPPVTVVDTVGAGDAFCGALVTALLGGGSIASGLRRACAAGALATTRAGAQPALPTAAEVDAVMGL